jgi:hypothetical protein
VNSNRKVILNAIKLTQNSQEGISSTFNSCKLYKSVQPQTTQGKTILKPSMNLLRILSALMILYGM